MLRTVVLAAALLAASALAQVANEGLGNSIITALQKNAALMKQYSWTCRTEISEDGTTKDTRVDTVTLGPDGQPQHTLLTDQSNPLPRGFFRKRIAEKEREKMETFLKGMRAFLNQYTSPNAGKVIDFISTAQIPPPGPNGVLQLSGSSVVIPGDTVSLSLDAPTRLTLRMTAMTSFEGDQITLTAVFRTLKSGLNYAAYIQVNVYGDKNLSILIQNYDYVNQNN